MRIVEVVWDDAWVDDSEVSVKKAKNHKAIRTRTVGCLIADNEHGLTIATDTYEKDKKTVKIVNFIPHGMIIEWWEYV